MTVNDHLIRPPEPKGRERRKTGKLLEYWHKCRGNLRVPLWSEALFAGVVDLSEFCVIWKSTLGTCSTDTRQIGARFVGEDTVQQVLDFPAAVMLGQIAVLSKWLNPRQGPILQSDKFDLLDGRSVKTRMGFMPFEDETPARTRWVALADWRVFDDSPYVRVHHHPASTKEKPALTN
ncbi:MAG: hypothetical protein O7I42_05430 [Alphaproteobacteria bacterium]|nr:hypothetical protein [Alphaproteobacteria bacterium]